MNKKPDGTGHGAGGHEVPPLFSGARQPGHRGKVPVVTSGSPHAGSPGKSSDTGGQRGKPSPGRNSKASFKKKNGWPTIYAALDLGTNNCRLLVARPTRRSFLVIDAFSRIIRLGEGVSSSGRFSEEAMDRTVEALKICSAKMHRKGVSRSRLIATEACRIADNSGDFISRVRSEAGLELEIIDQETEARLAVTGCTSLLDRTCDWALVFDIGGGSSELIWLDLNAGSQGGSQDMTGKARPRKIGKGQIRCWTSLPIGVVSLSEKFGGQHVTPQQFEEMVSYVMVLLEEFEQRENISAFLKEGVFHLLGTSGTVTTLAGIYLNLSCYDRKQVDGCWLKSEDIRKVSHTLVHMSFEQRVAVPCIGVERADLVLAGCAILEAIMRMWPCEDLRVADRGLREGILTTMMSEDGVYRQRRRKRRS